MNSPTLVLLYSIHSPKCDQLRSMIRDEHLNLFKPISVDNKEVRDIINNSTTIQIKSVPCILEIFPDGNIASYEDNKAFEWMSNFLSILEHKQQPQSEIPRNYPQNVSSLNDIGFDETERQPNLPGLQGRLNNNPPVSSRQPNMTAVKRGPRREAYRGVQEEGFQSGLTSERDIYEGELVRPMRGDGHQEMSTSLHEMQMDSMDQKSSRQVPYGTGSGVKMIEDLTPEEDYNNEMDNMDDIDEMDLEQLSGMKGPREDPVKSGKNNLVLPVSDKKMNRAKEKSNSIKNVAASLARARKIDEEHVESYKQGKMVKQRSEDQNRPVQL